MAALMGLIILPTLLGFVSFFCLVFLAQALTRLTQAAVAFVMNGTYTKPLKHRLRKSWDRP